MSRSRLTFFAIIIVAVIIVVAGLMLQSITTTNQNVSATAAVQATLTAVGVPISDTTSVTPIFAGGTMPNDVLPQYTCAADAFASYYPLEQMQQAGYDVQNGFHLGLVPFYLDNSYNISEDQRTELLASGKIDCLFTTLDSAALKSSGIITAVIDESAGADQMWTHGTVKTLNDLRGKKITFAADSVSQFFTLYALDVAGLNPRSDVTMIPADSVDDAVSRFNKGQADVVSGWLPNIQNAKQSNGQYLIGSDKLHVLVDVIMTSRQAIQKRPQVVQAFHNAWFKTLKAQFEDFPKAAKQIASWGHNDWSLVSVATPDKDLGSQLSGIAQAGLSQNLTVMHDTARLVERLDTARRIWQAAGQSTDSDPTSSLIEPKFVLQSGSIGDLATSAQPRNTSFLLAERPNLEALAPGQGETLAILPCRHFDFLPESAEITTEIATQLNTCVLPVLNSSTGTYLKVVGSAAWPANTPQYTENDILPIAQKRAQAVVTYLTQKGIDAKRFSVSAVLPPPEHRNTTDGLTQANDRYVEMTLVTVGR